MRKTISFYDLSNSLQSLVIAGWIAIALFVISMMFFNNLGQPSTSELQNQINQLPHKYCHNETTKELLSINWSNNLDILYTEFTMQDEITCEDGVQVYEFPPINRKMISACATPGCPGIGKTCIIETTKEVCEIR